MYFRYDSVGRVTGIYRGQDILQEFTRSQTATGVAISQSNTLTGRRQMTRRERGDGHFTLVSTLGSIETIVEEDTEAGETLLTKPDGMRVTPLTFLLL